MILNFLNIHNKTGKARYNANSTGIVHNDPFTAFGYVYPSKTPGNAYTGYKSIFLRYSHVPAEAKYSDKGSRVKTGPTIKTANRTTPISPGKILNDLLNIYLPKCESLIRLFITR